MSKTAENAVLLAVVLMLAPVLHWFSIFMPLHIDEAITHQYFVSEGWKIALTSYKFPNNHVLFSLLSTIFIPFFKDPIVGMRTVAVLAGLLNFTLLFNILRRSSSLQFSLLGSMLWLLSLGGFYYAVHARGYGLQLTFLLIDVLCVLHWKKALETGQSAFFWLLIIIVSSTLGFLTIPTFLFPYASLLLWMCFIAVQNGLSIKQLMATIGGVGALNSVFTGLAYAPLIRYSGIGALINNQWVHERKIMNLAPELIGSFLPDLAAYAGLPLLVLFLLSFVYACIKRKAQKVQFQLVFFIVPALIMAIMGSIPFPRTFSYLVPILIIVLTANLNALQKQIKWLAAFGLFAAIIGSVFYLNASIQEALNKPSNQAKLIHSELVQLTGNSTIYVDGWNEAAHLVDYYSWRDKSGPSVKFVYEEDFFSAVDRFKGSFVFSKSKLEEQKECDLLLERPRIYVYRCN